MIHEDQTQGDAELKKALQNGVKKAQKVLQERGGPSVGDMVAHPSYRYTCVFQKAEGDMAFIGLSAEQSPTGEEISVQFPLDELFDPQDAQRFAFTEVFPSQQAPDLN